MVIIPEIFLFCLVVVGFLLSLRWQIRCRLAESSLVSEMQISADLRKRILSVTNEWLKAKNDWMDARTEIDELSQVEWHPRTDPTPEGAPLWASDGETVWQCARGDGRPIQPEATRVLWWAVRKLPDPPPPSSDPGPLPAVRPSEARRALDDE